MSDTNPSESVVATCHNCSDTHPLSDRSHHGTTTACPHCGAKPYESEATTQDAPKPDEERMRDAVSDVDGVGETVIDTIVSAFASYYDFEAASATELAQLDGVGKTIAQRIVKNK